MSTRITVTQEGASLLGRAKGVQAANREAQQDRERRRRVSEQRQELQELVVQQQERPRGGVPDTRIVKRPAAVGREYPEDYYVIRYEPPEASSPYYFGNASPLSRTSFVSPSIAGTVGFALGLSIDEGEEVYMAVTEGAGGLANDGVFVPSAGPDAIGVYHKALIRAYTPTPAAVTLQLGTFSYFYLISEFLPGDNTTFWVEVTLQRYSGRRDELIDLASRVYTFGKIGIGEFDNAPQVDDPSDRYDFGTASIDFTTGVVSLS